MNSADTRISMVNRDSMTIVSIAGNLVTPNVTMFDIPWFPAASRASIFIS